MTAPASGPAWIEPTRAGRVRLVLERAAIFAWFMSHLWWVPAVVDRIDGANPCASLGTLQFLFAYALVVTCVPTLLSAWWAWHILRAGQSPTPGSRVLFRTRVRTGWFARFDALGFAAFAVILAVVPLTVWREIGGLELFLNHGC